MAAKSKTMQQIRNILQQKANGLSIRAIVRHSNYSRNTIRGYLRLIERSSYTLPESLKLSDEALGELLFESETPPTADPRYLHLQQKLPHYATELKKRHVTRQLLWEEYHESHPPEGGYGYTQFCHYLNQHIANKDVSALFVHKPAAKLMVDYSGDKLGYIDRQTGEIIPCDVLVTVLPFSSYLYIEAVPDQKQEYFASSLGNTFGYLGGMPECIVCDNMKTAVKKANRYEPAFTELVEQLSLHYKVTFMATRVRKPKDKATAETSVRVSYTRIFAKLRNLEAFSLAELNAQIREVLDKLNRRNFKGRNYSRHDLFVQYEQPLLKSLPSTVFEVRKTVMAKVQRNYHVQLGEDCHLYSVPYDQVGKQVKISYTQSQVEIYADHRRIAFHTRDRRRYGYSTTASHMPENHRAIHQQKGWDGAYFLSQAAAIGPHTKAAIGKILDSKVFPEQTFNSCLGALRLAGKYGKDRLEKACALLSEAPRVNYGILDNILKNNMDKKDTAGESAFKTPAHENIRGPKELF
tara:strand:- start:837 stop:2402 length:1566 start_codon:yes stop_codon:yes gene_type:complete